MAEIHVLQKKNQHFGYHRNGEENDCGSVGNVKNIQVAVYRQYISSVGSCEQPGEIYITSVIMNVGALDQN